MKTLLLTTLLLTSSITFANECKDIGDKAHKIMSSRQAYADIFKALEKYPDDKEMVIDAYKSERVDTMATLNDAITFSRNSRYSMAHDAATAKQKAIVDAFKMKYIAECLGLNHP